MEGLQMPVADDNAYRKDSIQWNNQNMGWWYSCEIFGFYSLLFSRTLLDIPGTDCLHSRPPESVMLKPKKQSDNWETCHSPHYCYSKEVTMKAKGTGALGLLVKMPKGALE